MESKNLQILERKNKAVDNLNKRRIVQNNMYLWIFGALVVVGIAWLIFRENSIPPSEPELLQDEVRILLVGKTGVGKSSSGNTILRENLFVSELSASSITTKCEKHHGTLRGRKLTVIDSPGLFDTKLPKNEVINQVKLSIPLSAPGPHAFLVVVRLDRFTDEDVKTVEIFQRIFGNESSRYTMVLFTHGDQLKGKSIHQFVRGNSKLKNFIMNCYGRYHVFNNEDQNPGQVIELLDQIDKMVTANGGAHYTTQMLQKAERAIEEEKERILKENEAKKQKEIEELKKQLEGEALEKAKMIMEKKYEEMARHQAERSPKVFSIIDVFLEVATNIISGILNLF